jgi:uncharacterized RDD family membrane protein YckC
VTNDDDLELPLTPGEEPDPLDRVLIQRPGDLFPAIELDRRGAADEAAESSSLFPGIPDLPPAAERTADRAAPVSLRAKAFAADAVLCAIISAAAFLSAAASLQRSPSAGSWIWCGVFAIEVSLFLCVPSLALFGKTPGMALSDLTVERDDGEKPPLPCVLRRWVAGILTILLAGLPLLTIAFDKRRRSPADLTSGWPLRSLPESLR